MPSMSEKAAENAVPMEKDAAKTYLCVNFRHASQNHREGRCLVTASPTSQARPELKMRAMTTWAVQLQANQLTASTSSTCAALLQLSNDSLPDAEVRSMALEAVSTLKQLKSTEELDVENYIRGNTVVQS